MTILGFSYDHRSFDGVTASRFLAAVRDALQERDRNGELAEASRTGDLVGRSGRGGRRAARGQRGVRVSMAGGTWTDGRIVQLALDGTQDGATPPAEAPSGRLTDKRYQDWRTEVMGVHTAYV